MKKKSKFGPSYFYSFSELQITPEFFIFFNFIDLQNLKI